MRVVFVHGACVRDGAWWWHRPAALLEQAGVASTAPLLPSCGETGQQPGTDGPGLAEDVAEVRRALDGDEPVVLVGHSYGGVVAAEAAAGVAAVRHLLLVSSYRARVGESLSSFGDGSPNPLLDVDPDGGTFGVVPATAVQAFLQDCDTDVQEQGLARMVRQSLSVVGAPVSAVPADDVPVTYLLCRQDRGTPEAAQRAFAERADRVVEVDAGHHPMLSRPAEVAELVLSLRI